MVVRNRSLVAHLLQSKASTNLLHFRQRRQRFDDEAFERCDVGDRDADHIIGVAASRFPLVLSECVCTMQVVGAQTTRTDYPLTLGRLEQC